jgi:tripartite-type tricarboxylate transporter receptor subunit TctC
MMRFARLLVSAAALLAACSLAQAQGWPTKPIRAIIPFGAGSATDVVPRVVFEQLSKQLGQPIVVENRGGAGGTIGATLAAKADPDGYTIMATSSAFTASPALYPNLSYDTEKDFVAIGAIGNAPNVFIIAPSRGIKTIQEFVAQAKAKPNAFSFVSLGVGSGVYLSAERFRHAAGYEAINTPFRGGAEGLTEVIAGRVDYYFCPIATALPFIREGQVLALAVGSANRSSVLPDVPTTLEAGFPDSDYTGWYGLLAPAKTPPEIVSRLHDELQKALRAPAVVERLSQLGVEPLHLSAQQFDERIRREIIEIGGFLKAIGAKVN